MWNSEAPLAGNTGWRGFDFGSVILLGAVRPLHRHGRRAATHRRCPRREQEGKQVDQPCQGALSKKPQRGTEGSDPRQLCQGHQPARQADQRLEEVRIDLVIGILLFTFFAFLVKIQLCSLDNNRKAIGQKSGYTSTTGSRKSFQVLAITDFTDGKQTPAN